MIDETSDRFVDINAPMRNAIDRFDWASTPLGPRNTWSAPLRTLSRTILDTRFPLLLMWGDELVQIYNQAFVPIFGEKHPASLGQPASECWREIWSEVGPLLRGVYERGESVFFENLPLTLQRRHDWEETFFTFSYSPVRDGDRIAGLLCIVNETTANVLREREAAERATALAELDRAKTQFFSNVSHEFRTPLTLMLGPLEDLVRTLPDFEQRERADLARRNAFRLQKLVNMLLDFSAAQSGVARAHRERLDVDALTSDLAAEFRSAFEQAGLSFEVRVHCGVSVPIDRAIYEKILLNLLSNALKFTIEGGVTVRTECEEGEMVLRVCDTGIGIADADLPRIFGRFARVQGARSRTHEGTGIGLALVQELIALHGGSIEVGSALGIGTTFTVRFPLEAEVEQTPDLVDTADLRRQFVEEADAITRESSDAETAPALQPATASRVLIADDNADLRSYLSRLLGTHYAVTLASDGAELLHLARTTRPDIIVADVMMPQVDGFEALRALREDPHTALTPVLLLSARAGEEAAADGLTRGADDYIVKPFVAADLLARIDALLRRSTAHIPPAIARRQRDSDLLSAAADRFIPATETAMVWSGATSVLVPEFSDWAFAYELRNGEPHLVSLQHSEPAKVELGYLLDRQFPLHIGDGSAASRALAGGTVVAENLDGAFFDSFGEKQGAVMRALDLHSLLFVPVRVNGETVAAFGALRSQNSGPFDAHDLRFLQTFAARAALAYENTRSQERERTIAATLQRALLPAALPSLPGLRFSATYAPAAQESLVGGDWYDAFAVHGRHVVVTIGDVVGHGLAAATVMASLRQAVRGFAMGTRDPGSMLTSLNRLLIADNPGRLATAFVAVVDVQTLEVVVASAGHHSAKAIRADGTHGDLSANGLILGVDDSARYAARRYELEPEDFVALFTDGYVENERDWNSGEARLMRALSEARTAADPATAVHLALFGANPPRDDAALVAFSAEPTLPALNVEVKASPESAAPARMALRRYLAAMPLTEERRFELLVAAGEAVVNAIEHAYAAGSKGMVQIAGWLQDDKVIVDIEDQGGGWDVESVDRVQRGYGIPLMHALSDAVDIARSAAGTRVRLSAKIGITKPEPV